MNQGDDENGFENFFPNKLGHQMLKMNRRGHVGDRM